MRLICETGGVAVLAHPWALKNPVAIIRRLKEAGLHGLEVYRSDGKLAGMEKLFKKKGKLHENVRYFDLIPILCNALS